MPKKAEVRITVRLPRVLYAALKAAAEAEGRSVNGQIELALKEHLDRRAGRAPPEWEERRGTFSSGRGLGL